MIIIHGNTNHNYKVHQFNIPIIILYIFEHNFKYNFDIL